MKARILVIDDEDMFREDVAELLREHGYECRTAPEGGLGIAEAKEYNPDVILCDVVMPGMGGVEVLEQLVNICPESCFIMITAYGALETAVEAFRKGASDYIMKPVIIEDVVGKIERYLERRRLLAEVRQLRRIVHQAGTVGQLIGKSEPMKRLHKVINAVSKTGATILLTGESGTGKELVARAIHEGGSADGSPFVVVNCAALPEHLFESELFGHVKGSFTGAHADREGFFTAAEGGTLFLDEVSEMPLNLQAKLLRAVETKEVMAVGSTRAKVVHARIISSTNRDLEKLVNDGKFREDLFYRLKVVEISLPPLRERLEDIPLLSEHFINMYNQRLKKNSLGVDNGAMRYLMTYSWPGNVRELENVIERAMILGREDFIAVNDLPPDIIGPVCVLESSDDLRKAMRACERQHVLQVLRRAGGNKEEAARRLGVNPATLYRKITSLSLDI